MIVTEIDIIISSVAWSSFAAIMCGAYLGRSRAQRPLTIVQKWMKYTVLKRPYEIQFFELERVSCRTGCYLRNKLSTPDVSVDVKGI